MLICNYYHDFFLLMGFRHPEECTAVLQATILPSTFPCSRCLLAFLFWLHFERKLDLQQTSPNGNLREMTSSSTRTRNLCQFTHSWCSCRAAARASSRPTAPPPEQRPITSVPNPLGTPKTILWSAPNHAKPNGGENDLGA